MPGQYIQNYQVQVYMRARETGCTQPEAAAIAGFSERSGRRIEHGEHQPKYGLERDWRTRPDPLAEVWDNEQRYQQQIVKGLRKKAQAFGFDLVAAPSTPIVS